MSNSQVSRKLIRDDPDDICRTGSPHQPDWGTLSISYDGGVGYIDVECKDCGRSGCIGSTNTLQEDINW